MAPVGTVGILSWSASPELGIISLVAFLVLSITLLALCTSCNRSSNAYDVSKSPNDGAAANGNSGTKSGETTGTTDFTDTGTSGGSTWRSHRNMPPNTLERPNASTD